MNIKSLKTQFIGAIAMVLVAAIAMGSSTYAWFAMNNKVVATGMEVKTQVSDNLLIAECDVDETALVGDDTFKTNYLKHMYAILEPVSSVDGAGFYYASTKNVGTSGDALSNVYIDYTTTGLSTTGVASGYKNLFSENYGVTNAVSNNNGAVGYVDYSFQLKAMNNGADAKYINLTSIDLLYRGEATNEKAYRVAVFVDDMGYKDPADHTVAAAATQSATNLKSILRQDSAQYFGAAADNADEAVSSTSALAAVNGKIDDAVEIGTVASQTTHYFKVVVRLWLEGEDTTCNNTTFASLTKDWALNLGVEMLNSNERAVTALGKTNTTATAVLTAATVSSNAATDIVVDGVTYHVISDVTLGSGENAPKLYTKDASLSATSVIYTFDGAHLTDVTNQCALPTT